MKIRTALTWKNTVVTATVFLLCMVLIYLVSEHTRSQTFFHDLKSEAVTKAHLFLQNQVDAQTMQSIYLNNRKFINEVEVAVYTPDFRMLYHDAVQNDIIQENREMIDRILREKEIEFYIGKYQGIGILYVLDGKQYIVTAAAYDGYGYQNLLELQKTLGILFVVGLSLLFVVGYFLARASLKPIRDIVRKAETITASHIDRRLPVKNEKDELGELSTTFNALLDRLEISFNSQRMFVSNASHELRTPLAALIAELDLALLLLDTRNHLLKAHPDYHIELLFEQDDSDDDRQITVRGNLYLLNIAFANLIENNCKYSADKSSFVQISFWEKWTIIRLSDDGVGMSETDKKHLFTLFYRGEQEKMAEGHGIGMTLVQRIIQLHEGNIAVHSEQGRGTTFVIELPHV